MCGFAGYFGKSDFNRENVIQQMGACIAHRGPDGEGSYVDDEIALAFRRLSIIDLEGGAQPMYSSDGRYVIVFNGEIYNYRELRAKLRKNFGCVFRTESDTEVILQTYIIYGEKTASLLRGMFAFIIYDRIEHKIYGARDYFGIKPFYYAWMNHHLLFGSEIKAFLPHPYFQKAVNRDALKMYLIFQYCPLRETIFKGVYKLEPGSYMTYDGNTLIIRKYFEPAYGSKKRRFAEAENQISEAIQESVVYHQISDVEVGAFLSGGVDSSYVTALAMPKKTYSVGFEVDGFDETGYSKALCRVLHLCNKSKAITADEFFDALPDIQYYSDEPHANLSAVPLYYLSELAANDVKVVLSGEGADELFGGYEAYRPSISGNVYRKIVPAGLRRKMGKWAGGRPPHRGMNFLKRNALDLEDSYIGHAFIMDNEDADEVLMPAWKSPMRYQDVTKPYYDRVRNQDELHKKLYLDMHLWLPNDILLKADRMTMAHSLELRVPYLDKKVWELARTLETGLMLNNKTTKVAFRASARHYLPFDWAKRKKKGFPVPIRLWLREDKYYWKVCEMFQKEFVSEFFDQKILLRWLDEHKSGKYNHQRKIYTVYAFLMWYEQYFILR